MQDKIFNSLLPPGEKEQAMQEMMKDRQVRKRLKHIGAAIVITIAVINALPSVISLLALAFAGVIALFGHLSSNVGLLTLSENIFNTVRSTLDHVIITAGATHTGVFSTVLSRILPIIMSIAIVRGKGWARFLFMLYCFAASYIFIIMVLEFHALGAAVIAMPMLGAAYFLTAGMLLFVSKGVKEYMYHASNNN